MTKQLKIAAAALALFSIGSSAHAGLPCPFNDKNLPEQTKVCRAGTIHRCEDGQWINLGIKCTSNYQEDAHAALSSTRRILGEASPRRNAIVARIAPQS
jgi:hypothetical protein